MLPAHPKQRRPSTSSPTPAALTAAVSSSERRNGAVRVARIAPLFVLCTATSLVADMLTKRILRQYARPGLAITVTFFHFAVSTLCGLLVIPLLLRASPLAAKGRPNPGWYGVTFSSNLARNISPLALCQAFGFLATNLSLKFVPVSFSHTVKVPLREICRHERIASLRDCQADIASRHPSQACECLFTATLAFIVLGERMRRLAYVALIPTATGVALSAASEMHFSTAG